MRDAANIIRLSVAAVAVIALGLQGRPSAMAAQPLTPKSVPVQVTLAEAMVENEDWEEAIRRWIDILYYFGPSDTDARAHFEIGRLLLRRGRSDLAAAQWEKAVRLCPESDHAAMAGEALQALGKEPPTGPTEPASAPITGETRADERQFVVAEADLAAGLLEFAIRDYLKVPNLYPASARAPQARFQVGLCQALLGRPERALTQWRRVQMDYPASPEAEKAAGAAAAWLALLEATGMPSAPAANGEWQRFTAFDREPDRGLSYAEDLYQNGVLGYALQEYAKVLCGVYTPRGEENPHRAYARYRMGVCAYELGHPEAAARQWQRLLAESPQSPWRGHADEALAALHGEGFDVTALGLAPALPEDLSSSRQSRHALAAQLLDCGLPLIASKEYLKVIHVVSAGRPNPSQAEAWYQLGVCHQQRGRADLARAAWQAAVERFPDSPWAEQARAAQAHAEKLGEVLARPYQSAEESIQ